MPDRRRADPTRRPRPQNQFFSTTASAATGSAAEAAAAAATHREKQNKRRRRGFLKSISPLHRQWRHLSWEGLSGTEAEEGRTEFTEPWKKCRDD